MKKLRTRFELFCYQNRDKGIPNLMLYITLGNAVVSILSLFNGGSLLYSALYFDKTRILEGQVWRLVTYVFTQSSGGYLGLLFLYFFYMLGRHVEMGMGTLKFNLFYLTGVLLMDIFAMVFATPFTAPLYADMAYYLHLSLILMYATTYPNAQFMIFFIIPIKAWVMALVYLLLVLASVFNLSYPVMYFPHNLFPLVALANYLLFTGKDIMNLLPFALRAKLRKKPQQKHSAKTGPIPFRQPAQKPDYHHRCTVCGKTDVSDPSLEFRYCSRCNGYHCYCENHINNHIHVE